MFLDDIIGPMSVEEAKATSQRLDAKCWKGYRKAGTKIKGGVRVNNCVPTESQKNEGLVGGGNVSPVPTDAQLKKMIWDALKIDAPTGVEALQKAIVDLTRRPQTRMVQTMLGRISMIADRMNIGPEYRNLLKKFTEASMAEDNWHGSTDAWHAGDNAWSSDQHEMVEDQLDEYPIQGPSPDDSQSPIPGNVEEDFGNNSVAGAIVRRIMTQHTDLLKQYGPNLVGAAIDNVADYVGDVDEIGSSDVSGWVKQVERMLQENPPEAFSEQDMAEAESPVDPILFKALARMPDGLASHKEVLDAAYDAYAMELGRIKMKSDYGITQAYIPQLLDLYKKKHGLTFSEAQTDYQKRRARERDVDMGKPVSKPREPKQTDYQKRRAQDRKDMELGEAVTLDRTKVPDYPQDSATIKHRTDTAKAILSDPKSDPESRKQASAILANTQKDMELGEENKGLYYNVNKRKKAGTSRPAGHPKAPTAQAWKDAAKTAKKESVDEEWSKKYKSSINCSNPKGFSQRAHCAGKKKNEDTKESTSYWDKLQDQRSTKLNTLVNELKESVEDIK